MTGRPRYRRGRKRAMVWLLTLVPLVAWLVLAATAGTSIALWSALLGALAFPLILAPQVVPDLWGRRGRVRVRQDGRSLTFPATAADRAAWGLLSVLLLVAPFVVAWDAERVGAEVSTQTRAWLWAAPALGLAGLVWQYRRRPTLLTLDAQGVTAQINSATTTIAWDLLPPIPEHTPPRLDHALAAAGQPFDGYLLASDPELVADLLELYRTHPELRSELATGATFDRLARGELTSPKADASP